MARIGRDFGAWAMALTLALPAVARTEAPDAATATTGAPPTLETRSIATRPAPKSPRDLLLPGETLRSRWADPDHPQAPGRVAAALPSAPARPAAPRPSAALPPPLPGVSVVPRPAAVAPARPAAVRPGKPAKPARAGNGGALRLDLSSCTGEYHLDGVAVDTTMGRPCAVF